MSSIRGSLPLCIGSFQTFTLTVRPGVELLDLFGREPCFRVHLQVLRQGHFPVADLNCHPRQKIDSLFYGVILPAREIHVVVSGADVLLDHPRHRGDIAVPGPFRSFGVAILTSAVDDAGDLERLFGTRKKGQAGPLFFNRSGGMDQGCTENQQRCGCQTEFGNAFHGFSCSGSAPAEPRVCYEERTKEDAGAVTCTAVACGGQVR